MSKSGFAERVAIPPNAAINSGLSPTGNSMKNIFGRPGQLTKNCKPVTNELLLPLIETRNLGPFRGTGFRPFLDALEAAFAKVETADKTLYRELKTAGITCCRLIRGSSSTFSIHSWGAAIDLYYGAGVVPLGEPETHVGLLRLYPYLHNVGIYWGAEFNRDDAMHWEAAAKTVAAWYASKWLTSYMAKDASAIIAKDKLILNDVLIPGAFMDDGSWWAKTSLVRGALGVDPGPSYSNKRVREIIAEAAQAVTKTGDHRKSKDRFYIYAA